MSNSMCLTSWKCDVSVTLLLDSSLEGKGWSWEGAVCSVGILNLSSLSSFTSSRKWKVYVGGSLPEETSKKTNDWLRFHSAPKHTTSWYSKYASTEWHAVSGHGILTLHLPSVESPQPETGTEQTGSPTMMWATGRSQRLPWFTHTHTRWGEQTHTAGWKQLLRRSLSIPTLSMR